MSKTDLQLWLTLLTGTVVPFVVSKYASIKIRSEFKVGLIILLSAIGGLLNYLITEGGFEGKTWTQIVINSSFSAWVFYNLFFKLIGIEKYIAPKVALLDVAKQQVATQVAQLHPHQVVAILDANKSSTLVVKTEVRKDTD